MLCRGWRDNLNVRATIAASAVLYAVSSISTGEKGSLTVYVRSASGTPISSAGLTVSLYGRWRDAPPVPPTNHLITSGHPAGGAVDLRFTLPASFAKKSVVLIVTESGAGFQAIHSLTCTDRAS